MPRTSRFILFSCALALALSARPLFAQAAAPPAPEAPPLRRWLEFQTLNMVSRYRFIENSADVITSNHWQYKNVVRARFNVDARHRYTINVGVFTGSTFIGSWDNTGIGTGAPKQFISNHYMKQLFAAAIPVSGVELQYGGLYVNRGENTEITSYDEDGYIVGERMQVRRPKELFFDEVSLTRAFIGPATTPSLTKRWNGLHESNYDQVLLAKRIGKHVRTSGDYTYDQGAHIYRGGVAIVFDRPSPFNTIRYEQYRRTNNRPAAGFAVSVERPVTTRARLVAGYTSIDEFYNGLNADRMQRGKRFFATGTIPISRGFTGTVFITRAVATDYSIINSTRLDVMLTYDLLQTLRRTGVF